MNIQMHCLILILCCSYLISSGQTNDSDSCQLHTKILKRTDTIKYAVFTFDTKDSSLFKNAKPADLTPEDIQNLDSILNKCISEYNFRKQKWHDSNSHIDLPGYTRQYTPIINEKGEKEVWVNCFCHSYNIDWRKQIILVLDGGDCYFNLKINLTLKTYYQLMVNGVA